MKKAFTLVELLIVVVVLVTLMGITFKLSSVGSDQSARNTAVSRLQKLENCLSGYYAAFGCYPPVRLHGSRNYKLDVSGFGIQSTQENDLHWNWFDKEKHKVSSKNDELEDWKKVKAACQAQPFACSFPFPQDWAPFIEEIGKLMGLGFSNINPGGMGSYNRKSKWRRVQIFKFGVMSYLLPRFLVMMQGDESFFNDHAQWNENNAMPCDPITGERFDKKDMDDPKRNWNNLIEYANSDDPAKLAHAQNIPSQAVCARWMPNLEGICHYNHDNRKFFGIDIRTKTSKDHPGMNEHIRPELYSPGDEGMAGGGGMGGNSGGNTSGGYPLDSVTVYDGFTKSDENGDGMEEYGEFYYYSPPPYQSYVLWSAGPNGRTFPPWVPRESLSDAARACVGYWTEDDIVIMSH